MVTSRLLLGLPSCRGDLWDNNASAAVTVRRSFETLEYDDDDDEDGDDRTIAPPFLGTEEATDLALPPPLLLLLLTFVVLMRKEDDVGDLAEDVNFSVGDRDDVTASWRKIRSLRRRYHSSV